MFQKILLTLIIFLLPTQLGQHFWPNFSYVTGFRIDYLSPTIYLIDILLFAYVILNVEYIIQSVKKHKKKYLIGFLLIVLNILFSLYPLNTLTSLLHLLLYLTIAVVINEKKVSIEEIVYPLVASSIFVIALEIMQFIYQGSIGGLFYWFGERTFTLSTPNIARIDIFGYQLLRPYSTFSHPNSLAGYLFLIILLVKKSGKCIKFLPILYAGILLSFSKSVILCLLIYLLNTSSTVMVLLIIVSTMIPLLNLEIINNLPYFITSRVFYIKTAQQIISLYPIFGVGYGGYIPTLPNVISLKDLNFSNLQPVHNTILLIVSEWGLLNLATVMVIKYKKILSVILKNRYLLAIILLMTFDHYFYTLPQNKILLMLSIMYLV